MTNADIDELELHMREAGDTYPQRVVVYLRDKVIDFSKPRNGNTYTLLKKTRR